MYLLDTDICIYYLKGISSVTGKLLSLDPSSYFISEITIAEMKYGIANSPDIEKMKSIVNAFIFRMNVIPIIDALDIYAKEKARLKKTGMMIDDFDLLIGATAIHHRLIMVTHNRKHFERLENIQLEDWITA